MTARAAAAGAIERATHQDPDRVFLDPASLPADRHRRAARLVLLDGDRVLLEFVQVAGDPAQGRWWELPGGGIDPGESIAAAAARELNEETGYLDVEVGPALATLRIRYRTHRHVVEQHETIHVGWLRSHRRTAPRREPAEVDGLLDLAWLTPAEVADGRRLVIPELAALVADAAAGRLVPRELGVVDVTAWSDAVPDPVRVTAAGGRSPIIVAPPAGVARAGEPDGAGPRIVVRESAPWTPAVHGWLAWLRAHRVEGVPAPLGVDGHGREAVTFVPGATTDAVTGHLAPGLRTDAGLAAVGRLLRRVHDAGAGFLQAVAETSSPLTWRDGDWPADDRGGDGGPGGGARHAARGDDQEPPQGASERVDERLLAREVVVHGDIGHGNVVMRPDGDAALIDLAFATPGRAGDDLAEAALMLVPLVPFDHRRRGYEQPVDHRARLGALAAGYGVSPGAIVGHLPGLLQRMQDRLERFGGAGIPPWDGYLADGQLTMLERGRAFVADLKLG